MPLKPTKLFASFIVAVTMVFSATAVAEAPKGCARIPYDNDAYRTCLSQWGQILEARLRHALDKVMIKAAEEDWKENEVGYGRRVRKIDREQLVWERTVEIKCEGADRSQVIENIQPEHIDVYTVADLECRNELFEQRLQVLNQTGKF